MGQTFQKSRLVGRQKKLDFEGYNFTKTPQELTKKLDLLIGCAGEKGFLLLLISSTLSTGW